MLPFIGVAIDSGSLLTNVFGINFTETAGYGEKINVRNIRGTRDNLQGMLFLF
jgi:hypothetical protein